MSIQCALLVASSEHGRCAWGYSLFSAKMDAVHDDEGQLNIVGGNMDSYTPRSLKLS